MDSEANEPRLKDMTHMDLKEWRTSRSLSLTQLEKHIGVCRQTLAKIEKGQAVSKHATKKVNMMLGKPFQNFSDKLPRGI